MDRRNVIAQYEAIRKLGQANMFDKDFVQKTTYDDGFYELVYAMVEDYGSILESYSNWVTLVAEGDIPAVLHIEGTRGIVETE